MLSPKIRNAVTKHVLGHYRKEDSGIQRHHEDGGLSSGNQWDLFHWTKGCWPLKESPTSANLRGRLQRNQGARNVQRGNILTVSSEKWRVSVSFIWFSWGGQQWHVPVCFLTYVDDGCTWSLLYKAGFKLATHEKGRFLLTAEWGWFDIVPHLILRKAFAHTCLDAALIGVSDESPGFRWTVLARPLKMTDRSFRVIWDSCLAWNLLIPPFGLVPYC